MFPLAGSSRQIKVHVRHKNTDIFMNMRTSQTLRRVRELVELATNEPGIVLYCNDVEVDESVTLASFRGFMVKLSTR